MLRIGQIEASATSEGQYTDGSVAGGIAATRLRAAAFNAMQEELAHIVESAGLALDINDMTQVLKAIQKLTLSRANPFADIKSDGAVAVALANLGLGNLKYGAPMIGELVEWPREEMPQEIWSDCGMEFIPYMAQSFDAVKYPLLAQLHPTAVLPVDMRGEFVRGWDNGRGVDSERTLLSTQGDAIRNITGGFKVSGSTGTVDTTSGAFYLSTSGQPTLPASAFVSGSSGAAKFDVSRVVPTASENRPRSIAFNYIVRAA